MLWDKENLFSDNQAITTTAASTNVLNAATGPLKEIAFGTPTPLRIQVTQDFTGATSVDFWVETATDAAFTTPVALAKTGAIAVASLKTGYVAPINFIPKGNLGYLRMKYTVVGTATAGKVTAGIVAGDEGTWQDM